jgi:uncharacterized metal-binding protein YceD (DUF177 family)
MQLIKSHLTARPLYVDEDLHFEASHFASSYPILGVKKLHLQAEFSRDNAVVHAVMKISGRIILEDSYTAKPFEKNVKVEEETDILEEENGEDDGFIIPGKFIDVEELSLAIIRFSLPIKVLAPGSKLPKSGTNYSVRGEDEAEEEHSSPFDALFGLDLPDKN